MYGVDYACSFRDKNFNGKNRNKTERFNIQVCGDGNFPTRYYSVHRNKGICRQVWKMKKKTKIRIRGNTLLSPVPNMIIFKRC